MVIQDLNIGDKVYAKPTDCVYKIVAKHSDSVTLEVVERNAIASFREQYNERLRQSAEADLLRRKYNSIYSILQAFDSEVNNDSE